MITEIRMPTFPNDSWTRVEIFLRAWGRLPETMEDVIDQKTLDKFCENWEAEKIKTVTVDLESIYKAIKNGEVKTTEDFIK